VFLNQDAELYYRSKNQFASELNARTGEDAQAGSEKDTLGFQDSMDPFDDAKRWSKFGAAKTYDE
jgi:hypothetical protein